MKCNFWNMALLLFHLPTAKNVIIGKRMLFITIYKVVPSGLFKSKNDYFKVNLFPKYKRIFNALHKCWTRRKKVASSAPAIHQSTINVILQQIELSNDILRWIRNIIFFSLKYIYDYILVKTHRQKFQFITQIRGTNVILNVQVLKSKDDLIC